MGGKGGGGGDGTVKFAPYLEAVHHIMLNNQGKSVLNSTFNVIACLNEAYNDSPYASYTTVDADDGFLGSGYAISSFPSLFDMFGKFMAGLDIEVLWSQIYTETVNGPEVQNAVNAHSDMLQDDLDAKVIPKFVAGYRDINAVMSSAFIAGKAMIADSKVKSLSQFTASLQLHMFDLTQSRWAAHLDWNKTVQATYNDMMKLYYSAKFDAEAREMEFAVKDKLWNLSLFDYGRSMLGALTGTAAAKVGPEPSQAAKSISMAASGAGAGAMIGQNIANASGGNYAGMGAAAGGVVGLAASFM